SFLKQHSDEEAVLKSFRHQRADQRHSKHVNVENELNEMHERYSASKRQGIEAAHSPMQNGLSGVHLDFVDCVPGYISWSKWSTNAMKYGLSTLFPVLDYLLRICTPQNQDSIPDFGLLIDT
ncbi:hypothetical protein Tco_0536639, partial [Tanacetum coccineum]